LGFAELFWPFASSFVFFAFAVHLGQRFDILPKNLISTWLSYLGYTQRWYGRLMPFGSRGRREDKKNDKRRAVLAAAAAAGQRSWDGVALPRDYPPDGQPPAHAARPQGAAGSSASNFSESQSDTDQDSVLTTSCSQISGASSGRHSGHERANRAYSYYLNKSQRTHYQLQTADRMSQELSRGSRPQAQGKSPALGNNGRVGVCNDTHALRRRSQGSRDVIVDGYEFLDPRLDARAGLCARVCGGEEPCEPFYFGSDGVADERDLLMSNITALGCERRRDSATAQGDEGEPYAALSSSRKNRDSGGLTKRR